MHGDAENPGITPRSIDEIFKILETMDNYCEMSVSCNMVELYMDNLIDLLPNKENRGKNLSLDIKEDHNGRVYLPNVTVRF